MIFLPAMLKSSSTKLPKGCTCCVHRLMLKDVTSVIFQDWKRRKPHEFFRMTSFAYAKEYQDIIGACSIMFARICSWVSMLLVTEDDCSTEGCVSSTGSIATAEWAERVCRQKHLSSSRWVCGWDLELQDCCRDVIWYSWGFFSGFSISDEMGHDGPHAIPFLPPDSFLAPKTDHRNEQITKKGEQIIKWTS